MAVSPIPEGYPQVSPYLVVAGADAAITFYCEVFGFTERLRLPAPGDLVGHAELQLGDSVVMVADAMPEMGINAPAEGAGAALSLVLYVEDVDAVFQAALDRAAVETAAVETKFYGDRAGQLRDPWGHNWTIMTHVEDVSPAELERRSAAETG